MVGSITTHAKDDGEKTPDSLVLVVGKKTASSSQRKNTRIPDVVVDNQSRKRTPDSVVKKKLSRSVSQKKTPDSVIEKKLSRSVSQKKTPDSVIEKKSSRSVSQKKTPDSIIEKKSSRSVSQKKTPDSVIEKKSSRSVSQNNTMSELRCLRRKSRKLETTFATSSYPTKPNAISYTLDGIYPFWDAP